MQLLVQGTAASVWPGLGKDPEFSLNNWGLRVEPADFISFSLGTISARGIVSRLKEPIPTAWGALRNPSLPQTGFSHVLASVSTETAKSVAGAVQLNADIARVGTEFALYLTLPQSFREESSIGEDALFPLYSVLTLHFPALSRIRRWNLSLFGGLGPVSPDEQNVWFRRRSWFYGENALYTAAEYAMQTKRTTLLVSGGVMKHPAGGFSGYVRTEGAIAGPAAGLGAVFAFTDPWYISFSGKTPDIIRAQLNPYLTLSGKKTVFRLGVLADIRLRRGAAFAALPWTTETFKLEARLSAPLGRLTFRTELKDLNGGIGFTAADIFAGLFAPEPISTTAFKVSLGADFVPPYGKLKRNWSFKAFFEMYPAAEGEKQKKVFSGEILFAAQPVSDLSLECTAEYKEKISADSRSIRLKPVCYFSVRSGKTGHALVVTFSAEKGFNSKTDQFLFDASIGYSLNFSL
jgi:hypothetical protein